jgi:Flp pilus assembly protein TadG
LIATVLMLLVFGIIEFGIWLSEYEAISSSAREGARVAAVRGTTAQVQSAITSAAAPYPIDFGTNGFTMSPAACTEQTIGQQITVRWTQSFARLNLLTLLPVLPDQRVITGVFRCE